MRQRCRLCVVPPCVPCSDCGHLRAICVDRENKSKTQIKKGVEMIGLIVWAILIIFIAIAVNGWGFVGAMLLFGIAILAIWIACMWAKDKIEERRTNEHT